MSIKTVRASHDRGALVVGSLILRCDCKWVGYAKSGDGAFGLCEDHIRETHGFGRISYNPSRIRGGQKWEVSRDMTINLADIPAPVLA